MMTGRSSSVLALVAIGLVSACSLIYGPSSEELSGGTNSGTSTSASSGTLPDGAPASSTSTTSTTSTSTTSSSSSSSGGPFVCPGAALACEDFESGVAPAFAKKVGTVDVAAGGHDSSRSLEAVLLKNEPSPYLSAALTVATHGATLSFWFKPDGPPPHETIQFRIASALWGDSCNWELSWQVWLKKDGLWTGTDAYDESENPSCGPVDFESKQLLPAAKVYDGNWHHVTVTMDASMKTRTTSTQVDAEPAVALSVASKRTSAPSNVDLAIGVPCIQENAGCFGWDGATYRVRFDDLAFTP